MEDRKLKYLQEWYDEIELVYEKVVEKKLTGMMKELEELALSEARRGCTMLEMQDVSFLTPEKFDTLPDVDKERIINLLGRAGITNIRSDLPNKTIHVELSAIFPQIVGCTMFDLLNRLEKLDGSLSELFGKQTLQIHVPLGGKKGLLQWEIFIMQLYPWLSVKEVSSNIVAEQTSGRQEEPNTSQKMKQEASVKKDTKKTHEIFWKFLDDMKPYLEFKQAVGYACAEVENAIAGNMYNFEYEGGKLTIEQWKELDEAEQLKCIWQFGSYGVVFSAVVCVDFAEKIPYCIAIFLLHTALTGRMKNQLIDAGDGTDTTQFVEAVNLIYDCCPEWSCMIASPVMVKFEKKISVGTGTEKQAIGEKKSFWRKLFGK